MSLDNRDSDPTPKPNWIRQKNGNTLNKNLSQPIEQFSPNAKLQTMRDETGKTSIAAVRKAAKHR